MSTRRVLALGAGVAVLLAVAGIASHGRPLSGGRGGGPTPVFFDYVATTVAIFSLAMLGVVVYALAGKPVGGGRPRPRRRHLLSSFVTFAAGLALAWLLLHSGLEKRLRDLGQQTKGQQPAQTTGRLQQPKPARNARLRWDEIAIVLVLLGGAAIVIIARRQAKRAPRPLRRERDAAVSQALDESLDDLRNDPDLRRAIIAAYSRMERALAGSGMPRHPAEAPFEYIERALSDLDTSAGSAKRLTVLFEWAKFSQHEPGPQMRDEAIDALVDVRDELRRAARDPVPP